jgi:hypothetical protein
MGPWTPSSALQYRALLKFAAREGHARVPAKHREDGLSLGVWVQHMRISHNRDLLSPEQVSTLERVKGWRWRVAPPTLGFDSTLRLLRDYARREGHGRVPRGHVESGVRLGQWVGTQRHEYKVGRLPPTRRRALEGIPGWSWKAGPTPQRVEFERAHAALLRFARREGHTRVPHGHRESGIALGQWVIVRRVDFRKGRLALDHVRRLQRLPGWAWDPGRERFQEMLALLRRFARREGHARVPFAHQEAGQRLGVWVGNRRMAFQHRSLPQAQAGALESVPGWTWNASRQHDPDRILKALAAFVRREGHARVPQAHAEDGLRLGLWVSHQRQAFGRGRLPPLLARRLERFPGWSWDPQGDRHRRTLALLRRYVKREGHACVPWLHVEDGVRLGQWVLARRERFRAGRLSKAEAAELESLPGWTWRAQSPRIPGRRLLAALHAFVRREGHSLVPATHKERGLHLGRWVVEQRVRFREGHLSSAEARDLARLPGWSWSPRDDRFGRRLALLRRYVKREGHAWVPYDHVEGGEKLGNWVSTCRLAYRRGRLPKERIAAFRSIPGWTWSRRRARAHP